MRFAIAGAALVLSTGIACAQDISVSQAYIPAAPTSAMAHAAYLELKNTGNTPRSLIGVTAKGYAMAHLHQSLEHDGVATMSKLHQLDIAPGQSVLFKPGGLHIMLMRPEKPVALGDGIELELQFSNGETLAVTATVKRHGAGS